MPIFPGALNADATALFGPQDPVFSTGSPVVYQITGVFSTIFKPVRSTMVSQFPDPAADAFSLFYGDVFVPFGGDLSGNSGSIVVSVLLGSGIGCFPLNLLRLSHPRVSLGYDVGSPSTSGG